MGTKFCNIFDAHVVGILAVQKLSLTAIGTPSKGLGVPEQQLPKIIYTTHTRGPSTEP